MRILGENREQRWVNLCKCYIKTRLGRRYVTTS